MAGAGYKLFNTGDVLTAAQVNTYLMEQTVMVFADAAARTTALTGVVSEGMISYLKDTNAVEVYDGSNWVSSDDPNAIQNSIINAKGDLIVGSANDTPSILSISSDGSTLVADSSASTGLRWQGNYAAGKNVIINGDFNIWQRGTSFNIVSNAAYTADRWNFDTGGSGNVTISRQAFTAGQTDVPGNPNYFLQAAFSAAGTSATLLQQPIENVATFAGQTVTFSFYAKVNSGTKTVGLQYIQNFGTGGSSTAFGSFGSFTLTTSWQRFSATFTLPSISGKTIGTNSSVYVRFDSVATGTLTYSFANVQLELGSVATAFQTATGTLQGELAACQRYYYRATSTASFEMLSNFGTGKGTTQAIISLKCPATMRVTPTAVDYANIAIYDYTNAAIAITSMAIETYASPFEPFLTATVASGVTVYRPYAIISNSTVGAYIGVSAEL